MVVLINETLFKFCAVGDGPRLQVAPLNRSVFPVKPTATAFPLERAATSVKLTVFGVGDTFVQVGEENI
jgi:hypothetical protein